MTTEQAEVQSWMNNEYFESILTKYEGQADLKLRDFSVSAGTNKGENYASQIFRATLNYLLNGEPKETSFILKTSPASDAVSAMLEEMGTFPGEAHIFENVIPECQRMIPNFTIAPRLVYADSNALVLEDLNRLDYKLANRKLRLNHPRAKLVLEKLAKFHAATAVLHSKDPEIVKFHLSSTFDNEESPMNFFFMGSFQETLETVRNTPELVKFVPHLEKFDIIEQSKKVFQQAADDTFRVLNHGDLWINNFFFSFKENNEPLDAILVDYQECFWGSPGIDLNHFFYTSCDFDVHERHFDELIEFYHQTLAATLNLLEFSKVPTLDDIKREIARKADQGLVAVCSIVPVMMIENSEHANPENFLSETEEAAVIRREVFGNPKFVDVLKFFLPRIFKVHHNL